MATVQPITDPTVNPHTDDDKEEEDDACNKTSAPSRRSLVLQGHTSQVYCLAALDHGRLASGSQDTSIIIWNLADGKQLAKLEGHTSPVRLAALGNDRLASGSSDNSTIIWNLADGTHAKLEGHTDTVNCLTALDDGRLASGSGDTSISIWSVAEG